LKIKEYTLLKDFSPVDTSEICVTLFEDFNAAVAVVDNSKFYIDLMQSLFNFDQIKTLIARPDFTMCFDGMHGVSGPYAQKIFGDLFGV